MTDDDAYPLQPISMVYMVVFQPFIFAASAKLSSYFVLFSSVEISHLPSMGTVSSMRHICLVESDVIIISGR